MAPTAPAYFVNVLPPLNQPSFAGLHLEDASSGPSQSLHQHYTPGLYGNLGQTGRGAAATNSNVGLFAPPPPRSFHSTHGVYGNLGQVGRGAPATNSNVGIFLPPPPSSAHSTPWLCGNVGQTGRGTAAMNPLVTYTPPPPPYVRHFSELQASIRRKDREIKERSAEKRRVRNQKNREKRVARRAAQAAKEAEALQQEELSMATAASPEAESFKKALRNIVKIIKEAEQDLLENIGNDHNNTQAADAVVPTTTEAHNDRVPSKNDFVSLDSVESELSVYIDLICASDTGSQSTAAIHQPPQPDPNSFGNTGHFGLSVGQNPYPFKPGAINSFLTPSLSEDEVKRFFNGEA